MLSIGTGLPSLPPAALPSPTNSKTLPSLPPATLPGQSQASVGRPAREGSGRPWRHAIQSRSPSPQPEVQAAVSVHAAPVRRARSPSPLQLVPPHTVQRSQSPQAQRVCIRSPPSLQTASRPGTPAAAKLPWREPSFEDVCSTSTASLRSFREQKKLPPPPQLLQAVTGSGVEMGSTLQAGIAKGISQVAWNNMSNGLSAHKVGLFQAALAPTAMSGSGAGAAWAFPGGPAAASEAAVRQLRREVEELRTELRQVKAALQDGEQRKEQEEHRGSSICNGNNSQEGDCKPDTNGHAAENLGLCENGADFPTKLREASISDPHPFMQIEPFLKEACLSMSNMACTEDATTSTQAAEVEPASIKLLCPVSNSSTMPGLGESIFTAECLQVRAKGSADTEKRMREDPSSKLRSSNGADLDHELQDDHCCQVQDNNGRFSSGELENDHCSQLRSHMHSNEERKPSDDHEDDPHILCCPTLPISTDAGAATTAASNHVGQLPIGNGMCGSICLDDELCNSHCDDATVSLAEAPQGQSALTPSAFPMLGRGQPSEVSEGAHVGAGTPGFHWHEHDGQDQCEGRFGEFPEMETGASPDIPSMAIAMFNTRPGEGGDLKSCMRETCERTFGFGECNAEDGLEREEVEIDGYGMCQRVDVNDELGSTQLRIDTASKENAQRVLASPAWGGARACRLPEASPSPTDNEDDFFSPSKDGSGSYILVSPSPCERSYIITQSRDEGKNQCSGNNLFSPIGMPGESSPTLSPSSSRLNPGYVSDTPDGQESVIAPGPAAVAAAVLAATSGDGSSRSEALPAVRAQRLPAAPVSISLATAQIMAGTGAEADLDPWDSQELDSARIGFNPKVLADPYGLHSRSYHVSDSASLAASLSESQSSFQTLMPLPPPPVPCFGLALTTPQSGGESRSLPRRYRSGASRALSCSSSTSSHLRCASPADSSLGTSRTQMPAGGSDQWSASSQAQASKYFTAPPPRESFHVEPAPPAEPPTWPGQEQYKWLFDAPSDSQGSALSSRVGSLVAPNAGMSPGTSHAGDLQHEPPLRTACRGILLRGSSSCAPMPTAVVTLPGAPNRKLSPGLLRSSSARRDASGARTPPRNVWTATRTAAAQSRAEAASGTHACAALRSTSMARSVSPQRDAPIASFNAVALPGAGALKWPAPPSILSRPPPT
mmetsp:Transcript_118626/g.215574  ORF Transcript_118626/g.215574 Transcript_118626/m.215574 type:complete len:1176 (+) Transcript_118626:77-3604(+)